MDSRALSSVGGRSGTNRPSKRSADELTPEPLMHQDRHRLAISGRHQHERLVLHRACSVIEAGIDREVTQPNFQIAPHEEGDER